MDATVLKSVFNRIRKNAAVGIDGVTKQQYEEHLQENLQDLLERLKSKRYRHQPIQRVHIPKPNGKTRPIGVSTVRVNCT
jgi:retron-type reverse transcriptase